jgi:hypothetical protein
MGFEPKYSLCPVVKRETGVVRKDNRQAKLALKHII